MAIVLETALLWLVVKRRLCVEKCLLVLCYGAGAGVCLFSVGV